LFILQKLKVNSSSLPHIISLDQKKITFATYCAEYQNDIKTRTATEIN
jgi:hypothetical protein